MQTIVNVVLETFSWQPNKEPLKVSFVHFLLFKQVSRGGNRHWLIVVDEFSDCTHSFFLNRKIDQIKLIPMWIKGLSKNMELRSRGSGLTTVVKIKAYKKNVTKKIWELSLSLQQVISTAPKLDNIMVRPERAKPPHTMFYGKDAKYMKYMRTFGEMAVVAIHEGKTMRSKLDNRGKTCMFVGYAEDHAGDVYKFLNIHTKRIIMSRDVRWLNIIWRHYRRKSIYARKQVELFLDEEERSIEDERSFGESFIEEEEPKSDGNNTPTQKKIGLDINMIGARKETLGKTRSQTKEMPSPRNGWKEQI